jgi:hypothetical protein
MAAAVAMVLLTAGLSGIVSLTGKYMASRRKSRSTAGQRVRTRPSSCGPNVRFAWLVMGTGVVGGGVFENVARMVQ